MKDWLSYKSATLGLIAMWIGLGLVSVHQQVPNRAPGEVYGWSVPFGIACMAIPLACLAYWWGRGK